MNILAARETVAKKPSRLNIVAQGLSNSLPRSLPYPLKYTTLKKREVAQYLHLTHTVKQKPDGVEVVHWASP